MADETDQNSENTAPETQAPAENPAPEETPVPANDTAPVLPGDAEANADAPVVGSANPAEDAVQGELTVSPATNQAIGQWAEETALSFINLVDIADVQVRRAAITHLKEEDLEILIAVTQSYINLQNFYAVESGNFTIAEAAKTNQEKLSFLKKWIGI